jgi:hypothetical protein
MTTSTRKNLFAFRPSGPHNQTEDSIENNKDIRLMLDLANICRFFMGKQISAIIDTSTVLDTYRKLIDECSYLQDEAQIDLLASRIYHALENTKADNNLLKLPASNLLLLFFRFFDVMVETSIKLKEGNVQASEFWKQLDPKDREILLLQLNLLKARLACCLKVAFGKFDMTVTEFFEKYRDHKLWQNSLNNKELIIEKIK